MNGANLHSLQHGNANDEIEAIATELGTLPKGSFTSVKARFENLDTITLKNNASNIITAPSASAVPLISRGAASQTGDLQQWQNSAGTSLAKITSAGAGQFASGSTVNGQAIVVTNDSRLSVPLEEWIFYDGSNLGGVANGQVADIGVNTQYPTVAGGLYQVTCHAKIQSPGNAAGYIYVNTSGTSWSHRWHTSGTTQEAVFTQRTMRFSAGQQSIQFQMGVDGGSAGTCYVYSLFEALTKIGN